MHIFSEGLIRTLSRTVLAVVVATVLLVPVVLISLVQSQPARLGLVVLANALFVAILSLLARQRVGEVFVAGATYAVP
jgi:hypothetical protein